MFRILYAALSAFPVAFQEVRGWGAVVGALPFMALLVGKFTRVPLEEFRMLTAVRYPHRRRPKPLQPKILPKKVCPKQKSTSPRSTSPPHDGRLPFLQRRPLDFRLDERPVDLLVRPNHGLRLNRHRLLYHLPSLPELPRGYVSEVRR